jgi:DUF917 family protein
MGLSLVDADGMRRASPEFQTLIRSTYGISASPMAIADHRETWEASALPTATGPNGAGALDH